MSIYIGLPLYAGPQKKHQRLSARLDCTIVLAICENIRILTYDKSLLAAQQF